MTFRIEGCRTLVSNDLTGIPNTIKENDPLSAHIKCYWVVTLGSGDCQMRLETTRAMHVGKNNSYIYIVNQVKAFENDKKIFDKTKSFPVKRDFI